MVRHPRAVGLVALLVTGVAVSTGASAREVTGTATTEPAETTEASATLETPAASLPAFEPAPIEWTSVGEQLEEGRLDVPMDYANPDAGSFSLYLVRHLANNPDERIGSLLGNIGGPGISSTILAESPEGFYGSDLIDRFDIVAWDPRGVGQTEPAIDCIDDYDEYYAVGDITPDDDAERQQLVDLDEDFTAQCVENTADFIEFVGTNNSARDMDTIRRALGEDEISYFGFSYGSELGATWATLFPETVRAAVFDGAVDPTSDELTRSLQQVAGFEAALDTFLAQCSDNPDCPFHNDGDAEAAFDQLMVKIDEKPLPTEPGRPPLTRGMALDGMGWGMWTDAFWPDLEQAVAEAIQGDGSGLLYWYDQYYEREPDGSWPNGLEAFQVISCMDTEERPTVEETDAQAPQFNEVAPRFSPGTAGGYFCTFFPESTDPRVEITGAGAGPIVVCGTTGDPTTPLDSTRAMANTLEDGRLIIVEANQHTCSGIDECADGLIEDYLINLNAPPEVTEC
jgi:pimeloyl-ACP methyl ester carboxylesterase